MVLRRREGGAVVDDPGDAAEPSEVYAHVRRALLPGSRHLGSQTTAQTAPVRCACGPCCLNNWRINGGFPTESRHTPPGSTAAATIGRPSQRARSRHEQVARPDEFPQRPGSVGNGDGRLERCPAGRCRREPGGKRVIGNVTRVAGMARPGRPKALSRPPSRPAGTDPGHGPLRARAWPAGSGCRCSPWRGANRGHRGEACLPCHCPVTLPGARAGDHSLQVGHRGCPQHVREVPESP